MLYSEIWDNKPPMLYVFYALVNGDQFLIRLLSLIFGVLSVIAFFYLAKKLFNKYQPSVIATALFAVLFGIPMFEGNIANAENFMLLPTMLAGYLVLQFQAKEQPRQLFIAGLLLGLAFLFKIVAIFDLFAFTLFLILPLLPSFRLLRSKDTFHKIIRAVIPLRNLWMGFLLPFCITALFFLISGSLVDFLQAAFITNVGYVDLRSMH